MQVKSLTLTTCKAVDAADGRWVEGWASTNSVDRIGDVVEPSGCVYELPLPLLWAHDHKEPIGSVREVKTSAAGIFIRARLTDGVAKAEEIWRLIVDGAVNAVSIGFQVIKSEPIKTGYRFLSWTFLELSIVSVGANPEAKIRVANGKSTKSGHTVVWLGPPKGSVKLIPVPKS